MKVLVTGGTGRVGRCAVNRLVRNGHEVRVIGRRKEMAIERRRRLCFGIRMRSE